MSVYRWNIYTFLPLLLGGALLGATITSFFSDNDDDDDDDFKKDLEKEEVLKQTEIDIPDKRDLDREVKRQEAIMQKLVKLEKAIEPVMKDKKGILFLYHSSLMLFLGEFCN